MNSQKRENLLNLSLDSTPQERVKSGILETGYDIKTKKWEVIVKYHGEIGRLNDELIQVEELTNGYAIITLPEILMDSLSGLDEIEYIEKPKSLVYNDYAVKLESCIIPVTAGSLGLQGLGVLIGIIDSGIDYFLPDFQNQNGSRILYLWDQSLEEDSKKGWRAPEGFSQGAEFNKQQIDAALATGSRGAAFNLVPERDISGHGTAVAAIAAGSSTQVRYQGIAPESDLLVVKLGPDIAGGFPRTTQMMRAVAYVQRKAIMLQRPVVINMSFGNTYGAHDGTSLLERYMDNISETGRSVICIGSGNEAASGGHTSGRCVAPVRIELSVGEYERTVNVQLWKNYYDRLNLQVTAPGGEQYQVDMEQTGRVQWQLSEMTVLIYVGMPNPYSVNQEIFFDFIPVEEYITDGIWTFLLSPVKIVTGNYQMYLPSEAVRNENTRFITPDPTLTLTIPSTAGKVITVGAYNQVYQAYADFSGRGDVYTSERAAASPIVKPDITAPGVAISSAVPGGGYETFNGTSFSTPAVSGG